MHVVARLIERSTHLETRRGLRTHVHTLQSMLFSPISINENLLDYMMIVVLYTVTCVSES